VRRNTTPSRSRRQTTAFTAAGRRYGALKYRRPLVPSFKPALARSSASPVGSFIQPSPYSGSVCTANDRVAESVPDPDGRLHRDLRVVRILHWVDQLPTRDSECSVSRFRYPVEGEASYARKTGGPRPGGHPDDHEVRPTHEAPAAGAEWRSTSHRRGHMAKSLSELPRPMCPRR
jgi:hypothetical protein